MDAIIGTAEAVEGAPDAPAAWGEGATAADQGQEQAASEAVPQEEARHEEPSHEQAADEEVAFEEPAFEEPVFEETAHEEPAHEEPAHEEPAHEDPAHEDPAHEEPAHEDAGAGRHPSAEAPDAWATSEDPLAAGSEVPAMGEAAPPEQAWGDPLAEPAADSAEPGHVIAPKTDKFAPVAAAPEAEEAPAAAEIEAPPEWGEAPAAESPEAAPTEEFAAPGEEFAAPEEPDAPGKVSVPPTEEHAALDGHEEPSAEAPAADEFSEQGELKIEGWVAPPAEPEPQGAGWFGQALEATTPLSAADLGALASGGVDPNDGVGALRLLATLVRVLHRHQLLDPDEVADEVRESRAQASAERAAAESDASGVASADGPGSSAAEQAPPEEPAET